MKRYCCYVEDDGGSHWYFHCWAENQEHAIEQALDESTVVRVLAVSKVRGR